MSTVINSFRLVFIFFISFNLTTTITGQNSEQLKRTPAISPNGDKIAFSHQGDIWIVNVNGGNAKRVTVHESYDINPSWMDDESLVFESNRFGHADIFVSSPIGSTPRRLTYHSSGNSYPTCSGKEVFFSTNRIFNQIEWSAEVYVTSIDGGTPYRAMNAMARNPMTSSNGKYIAYERGPCRTERVAYKGSANRDIWIYDRKKESHAQITHFNGQDILPTWSKNEGLYYLSAQNGVYNLYFIKVKQGKSVAKPIKITNFTKEGIRSFHINDKNKIAVIERGTKLYQVQLKGSKKVNEIEISTSNDYHFYPTETKSYNGKISDYNLSPDEKYISLTIHGEVFMKAVGKDRSNTNNLSRHAFQDQNGTFLNDSTLLFISDRDGQDDIYKVTSTDTSFSTLFESFKLNTEKIMNDSRDQSKFLLSHNKDKILIRSGLGFLQVANIDSTGKLDSVKTLLDGWATPNGLCWSPDDEWIAYSLDDLDFNSEVFIQSVSQPNQKINVSMHPRPDRRPFWSPDGSKLGFLSKRNNDDWDVWFAWLNKKDWEKTNEEWEELSWNDKKEKKSKKDSTDSKRIKIDTLDLYERLTQVTSLVGNEDDLLISKDGNHFYFTSISGLEKGDKQKHAFYEIKWDGTEPKKLLDGQSMYALRWNKDYNSIYFLSKGKLKNLNIKSKKAETESVKAQLTINHIEERKQVFNDAWRAIRDGFYDPEFHGKDWEKLKERYQVQTLSAGTKQEFRLLFNEMLGQLNASHMGIYGGNPESIQHQKTGLLGIEVKPSKTGVKVSNILEGSPADREENSLMLNDIIIAINGQKIEKNNNLFQFLDGQAGKKVWLEIERNGELMDLYLRPSKSLHKEKYEAWVKWQKSLTDKYSKGKLGYIHIQGMNWGSFERFQRELTASGNGKEGIVVDVRYNGGGWTTDMLMAIMTVRQHAYTIPRGAAKSLDAHKSFSHHYPFGERLAFPPLLKPTVALCNESSYSNAEIFSHAYKYHKLGKLVGIPTFGAVISTGGKGLMDGSFIRMPFRAWYAKGTNKNMEWDPAIPDEIISNKPHHKSLGEDLQLKKAVNILLE